MAKLSSLIVVLLECMELKYSKYSITFRFRSRLFSSNLKVLMCFDPSLYQLCERVLEVVLLNFYAGDAPEG